MLCFREFPYILTPTYYNVIMTIAVALLFPFKFHCTIHRKEECCFNCCSQIIVNHDAKHFHTIRSRIVPKHSSALRSMHFCYKWFLFFSVIWLVGLLHKFTARTHGPCCRVRFKWDFNYTSVIRMARQFANGIVSVCDAPCVLTNQIFHSRFILISFSGSGTPWSQCMCLFSQSMLHNFRRRISFLLLVCSAIFCL